MRFADFLVIIMAILGFLFPAQIIKAIRSVEKEKYEKYELLSCLCFGAIMLIVGMFLNS